MGFKYNPVTGKLDLVSNPFRSESSDPSTANDGETIINTSDNKMKIYYSFAWQDLHTLTTTTPLTGNPMGLLLTLTYASDA